MKAYVSSSHKSVQFLLSSKREQPEQVETDSESLNLQVKVADTAWGVMRSNVQENPAGTLISDSGLVVQRKMTLGTVGDRYEDEADRLAPKIVQQINTPGFETKPQVASRDTASPTTQKALRPSLQLKSNGIEGNVPSQIESAINQARGGGQPLEAGLQHRLGQAMGTDFSGVRVHTDALANRLNNSLSAQAFTTGQDLFFKRGKYQPNNNNGQLLIAHELTHVAQQSLQRTGVQAATPKPNLENSTIQCGGSIWGKVKKFRKERGDREIQHKIIQNKAKLKAKTKRSFLAIISSLRQDGYSDDLMDEKEMEQHYEKGMLNDLAGEEAKIEENPELYYAAKGAGMAVKKTVGAGLKTLDLGSIGASVPATQALGMVVDKAVDTVVDEIVDRGTAERVAYTVLDDDDKLFG